MWRVFKHQAPWLFAMSSVFSYFGAGSCFISVGFLDQFGFKGFVKFYYRHRARNDAPETYGYRQTAFIFRKQFNDPSFMIAGNRMIAS